MSAPVKRSHASLGRVELAGRGPLQAVLQDHAQEELGLALYHLALLLRIWESRSWERTPRRSAGGRARRGHASGRPLLKTHLPPQVCIALRWQVSVPTPRA